MNLFGYTLGNPQNKNASPALCSLGAFPVFYVPGKHNPHNPVVGDNSKSPPLLFIL
jgi:hypothetical protein